VAQPWADDESLVLPQDVVTGEAVALDLRPASFATRVLAYALDLVVLSLILAALSWVLVELVVDGLDPAAGSALLLTVVVAVLVLLPAGWETATRGRSPGKKAAGLRVVRDDGGPIRWRQALLRSLVAVVEIYLTGGSMALICSLWNARGKRIGDLLAGTYVVRERVAARSRPAPVAPPELAGWVAGADIGRLPDDLAQSAHQFLDRAPGMHPGSRTRMGTDLAGRVARYVAPSPPGQVSPEAFLAAVLAERHRRALVTLGRQQQRRDERIRRRRAAPPLSASSTQLIE
jgi:uncharacterized RDD family membrane protein YckC